jgi:arginyl-tRNA--protein-N-Asp/Glu arginylyltransferase
VFRESPKRILKLIFDKSLSAEEVERLNIRGELFDAYLSHGFFPQGSGAIGFYSYHIYSFDDIRKIWNIRYDLNQLTLSRQAKRIINKNKGFSVQFSDPFRGDREFFRLMSAYIKGKSNFYPSTKIHFILPLDKANPTQITLYDAVGIRIYDGTKLVAGGIFYKGQQSVASISHFYDFNYKKFSIGKYLILVTLDWMRERQMRWYYPGYIIAGVPELKYKLFLNEAHCQSFVPIYKKHIDISYPVESLWIPWEEEMFDKEFCDQWSQ